MANMKIPIPINEDTPINNSELFIIILYFFIAFSICLTLAFLFLTESNNDL